MEFTVEGFAFSSEQINLSKGSAGALPTHVNFGFIFIKEDVLKSAFGIKVYNQICVSLNPGADLKQVEEEIDRAIGDNLIGITARDDTNSGNSINSFIQQFKTLSAVFPLLFFLVTALITQSTMIRLVEKQRGEIGVLKALGYSKRSILWHFTSYGIYIGLLGAFIGLIIGPNLFGRILVPRLNLTFADYSISVNYVNFIYSLILILACTGGVSLFACLRLLGESPASLLRDKPPKEGGHIFLERFSKLWNRMKFSSKLIARNTVKNKTRLIMSILGIMGCAGLIVGAIALSEMISGISAKIYGNIYLYDQKIILDPKADSRLVRNKQLDGIVQEVKDTSAEIICPDGTRTMKSLTVLPAESPLITLKDLDGNPVELSDNGIAMTRKLAETLHVKLGDSIEIKRSNDDYVKVYIDRIFYMAAGQSMYMTQSLYESIGETFRPSAILLKWNGKPDEEFLKSDSVKEYVDISVQVANTNSNTTVVLIAATMMILMGAILAFVVLYNSSILNYTERIRDLATLEVLGFYQKEIRALVLTENILSVILGVIFGVPLGKALVDVVASTLDNRMDLVTQISVSNILISGSVTLVFALIVNAAVAQKMKKLDMLDALKSVE
jgi:putative ABC transport system permease protein